VISIFSLSPWWERVGVRGSIFTLPSGPLPSREGKNIVYTIVRPPASSELWLRI
jgi:hypothetical protein